MTEVARGEVDIVLNDSDLKRGLEAARAEFKAATDEISRMRAVAHAELELSNLEDKVANAKRLVRELDGQRAEVEAGVRKGDIQKLDAELKRAREEVRRLDGQKATIEIDVKGMAKAAAAQQALARANERERKSQLKYLNDQDRLAASQDRRIAKSHSDAMAMDRARTKSIRDQTVGVIEQERRVVSLQQEYKSLSDRMEGISKKHVFGREERLKLALDTRGILLDMERVKAELQLLGDHPPLEFHPKVDRKGIKAKFTGLIGDIGRAIANKGAGLGELTTRIGPFTGSIKQFGVALAFLGPVITDLLGAAGALVGVVGAGLAGAMTLGTSAVAGLGFGLGGLLLSFRTTKKDMATAKTATDAYTKAVQQYGKGSKEAKTAQDKMNSVLKSVTPLAREAALGLSKFQANWDKATKPTQRSFGNIAKGFFGALNAITPMWAKSTNNLSHILDTNLRGGFKFLRSPEFRGDFKRITSGFNAAMGPMLHGLGNFGRAFLNFASQGAQYLKPLAQGFSNIGQHLLSFTQGKDFGATIKRWVTYAGDLARLFGVAGSALVHFFGLGSKAGDGMLRDMTNAISNWNKNMNDGHVRDFFNNAVAGAQSLWSAFSPIVDLFALWSAGLSPAVHVITSMLAGLTKAFAFFGKFVGLKNPLATLGATLGALWAVGKIGAFIGMLGRVVELLRTVRSLSTGFAALKALPMAIKGVGAAGAGAAGAAMETGASTAAATLEGGGAAAGAELEAGAAAAAATLEGAGAAAGAESALGGAGAGALGAEAGVIGGAGAEAATAAEGFGAAEAAAGGAEVATAGLLGESALLTGGLSLLGAAAIYASYKLITHKDSVDKARDAVKNFNGVGQEMGRQLGDIGDSAFGVAAAEAQAADGVRATKKALDQTTPGTRAHREAMLQYRMALIQSRQAQADWGNTVTTAEQKAAAQTKTLRGQANATDTLAKAAQRQLDIDKKTGSPAEVAQDRERLTKALRDQAGAHAALTTSMNREAAVDANYARIWRGMPQLTDKATQSIGALARTAGGKSISKNIAINFHASGDVSKVAASAKRALDQGVPKRIVSKIVVDVKDANTAARILNNLNRIHLTAKQLNVIEHGGQAAVAMLQKIIGHKLTPKQQKIAQQGGQAVLNMLGRILSRNLDPKNQNIHQNGGEGVLGVLGRILGVHLNDKNFSVNAHDNASGTLMRIAGLLGSLASKTISVVTNFITHGHPAGHASGGVVGGGAPKTTAATVARQVKAIDDVRRGMAQTLTPARVARGARVQGVRAIVGEEPMFPEFVISTNPAYKKSNIRYVQQAANMLGINMAAAGSGNPNNWHPNAGAGNLGIGLMGANDVPDVAIRLPRHQVHRPKHHKHPLKFHHPRKKKNLHLEKSPHPWARAVTTLQHQQDLWQREVSFREGRVKEPDDFLNEVKDDKGNVTGYTLDQSAIDGYKKQIQNVLDALKQLLLVIYRLLQAIPNAIKEYSNEIQNRQFNIATLTNAINSDKQLAKQKWPKTEHGHQKGEFTPAAKEAQKRITVWTKRRDKEKTALGTAKTDRKALIGANEDAAFDWKETLADYNDNKLVYDNVQHDAQVSLLQSIHDLGDGGSGGGSGSGTPSYGDQVHMADTEAASILQSFGGNIIQTALTSLGMGTITGVSGAGGTGAGGGGPTNIANLASVSDAGGGQAAAAVAAPSSSAQATSSSAQAAAAVSAPSAASVAAPASQAAVLPGGGTQSVTVNNTFATVPPDPHTWSRGVQFELGSLGI